MAVADSGQLQAINQIAEALNSSERRRLFYLCDSSPDAEDCMARVKETLTSKVVCQDGGLLFLAELLMQLRRFDILRRVCGIGRDEVVRSLGNQQVLPEYKVLMAHISEDLSSGDLGQVKFLMGNLLPREAQEKANSFLDVIIELEKLDVVSPDKVDFVERCMLNIGRVDLAKKVAAHKMSAVASPVPQTALEDRRCRVACPPASAHHFHSQQQTRWEQPHHAGNAPAPVHTRQSCQTPMDLYKFNSDPRGACVIIDCVGSDGGLLEQTFKALHFDVTVHTWLSADGISSVLRDISKHRQSLRGDGLVCCIISRGTTDQLLGVDNYGTGLHLDAIRRLFTAEACPMMAGKPKLFFIQTYSATQTRCWDDDLETDGDPSHLSRCDVVPTDADVFWSHCWMDECQLQQGNHHSVYLKALTDSLIKGQKRKTKLIDLHLEVNGAIFEHNRRNPAANYHIDLKHTLRKDLYLQ